MKMIDFRISNCCSIRFIYLQLEKNIVRLISHLVDNQYNLKNSHDIADTLPTLFDANKLYVQSRY